MLSAMKLFVAPTGVPAYAAYRQDQETTATLFQVSLDEDTVLTVADYAPGELVNVRMTQDAVGGHTVLWGGATFEGDTSLLVPDPTANTSTFVVFIVRTESVLEIIAGGPSVAPSPGGGGTLFVPNWEALLLVDGGPLLTGQLAFVGNNTTRSSYKDFAILDKNSATAISFGLVGAAIGGGQWLRQGHPSSFWRYQTVYHVDPANVGADDQNNGLSAVFPLATLEEFKRRVSQTGVNAPAITCNLHSDYNTDFTFDQSFFGSEGSVTFDGVLGGTKILNNAAITAVTTASPIGGAGGTDGTITIVGSFATSTDRIGIINAGPRVGARFSIIDLGAGVARVGNVADGPFAITPGAPVVLVPGDTFDTWDWPHIGGIVTVEGNNNPAGTTFQNLDLGTDPESMQCVQGSTVFFDSCTIEGFLADQQGFVEIFTSVVRLRVEANGASVVYLEGGHCDGDVYTFASALTYYVNYTMQGGTMEFPQNGPAQKNIPANSWVASFDTTKVLDVSTGAIFRIEAGAAMWGTNNTGPRITIDDNGSTFIYDGTFKPNIIGPGAVDLELAGLDYTWTELPRVSRGGSLAISNTDADNLTLTGPLLGTTVLTAAAANFTTGPQTRRVYIRGVGGAGAGGGCTSAAASAGAAGGGGSGGYIEATLNVLPNTAYAYTCGAGGVGALGAAGGDGVQSTFVIDVTHLIAHGGGGAPVSSAQMVPSIVSGGLGGAVSTGGDVNGAGTPGNPGFTIDVTNVIVTGGNGASSAFGGGALQTAGPGDGNPAPPGFGNGGAGSATGASTARTGGDGRPGFWIVAEYG